MSGKSLSNRIFAASIIILAAVSIGASNCPPPMSNPIISAKKADIHRYHFKDSAFDCDSCHPDAANKGFKAQGMESDGCYECHERVDKANWVHGPVGVGQCSVCHEPHGSKTANFLRRHGDKLCMFCHDQDRLQTHITAVKSNDCMGCHDPHAAKNTALLRK